MLVLHAVAAVLAAFRLTELITMDRISEPIRQRWPHYLWGCPRCVSVWAGGAATACFFYLPWLNWPLAISWLYLAYMSMPKKAVPMPESAPPVNNEGMASINEMQLRVDAMDAEFKGIITALTERCTTLAVASAVLRSQLAAANARIEHLMTPAQEHPTPLKAVE